MSDKSIEIDRYCFKTVSPAKLTEPEKKDLQTLIWESVKADYPNRSGDERVQLVTRVMNRAEGKAIRDGTMRNKQSLANRSAVLAFEKGADLRLVAYLGVADAASSRRPKPLNEIEQYAKLHVERFIDKKWRWLAMRALSPGLRPASYDPSQLSVIDVMGFLAVDLADKRQPVSAYPYEGEAFWSQTLESWGLTPVEGEVPEPIHAFGEEYLPVLQTHMTAETRDTVLVTIGNKDTQHLIESYIYPNLEQSL